MERQRHESIDLSAFGTRFRKMQPLARKPIAGVPRNFATGHLLALVTLFALGVSLLAYLKAESGWYLACGLFIVPVVLGQMFLYGGRQPRLASCVVGACTMPVLALGTVVVVEGSNIMRGGLVEGAVRLGGLAIGMAVPAACMGLLFGYLAGTLCAGVFLITERAWDAGKVIQVEPILAEVVPEDGDEPESNPPKSDEPAEGDPWSND